MVDLRDWFAGQALAGLLAGPGWTGPNAEGIEQVPLLAYQLADAMLEQRDKTTRKQPAGPSSGE